MTDPLRVLLVAGEFPLASETFVRRQCLELVEQGVDLDILALRPGDGQWTEEDRRAGLPGRTRTVDIDRPLAGRLGRMPGRLLRVGLGSPRTAIAAVSPSLGWRAMGGQLLEIESGLGPRRRYDAIHCEFGPMGRIMLDVVSAGILEGPLSVAFYGYDITREIRKHGPEVYARLFESARLLLPNSEYLASRLRAASAPEEKVVLHRLGVDLDHFQFVDRRERSEGTPTLLAVGRFVEKKGFEDLIRAVGLAGDRSAFRLRIVGDGPLRPRLESVVAELDLGSKVEMPGWRTPDEVAEEMVRADALAMSSVVAADGDMEGLPLVIAEAMSTGLPILGTDHSGIPEAVADGRNGRVVDEGDIEALAEALVAFSDPGRRLEAGRESRAIAEVMFDTRKQGETLHRLLRSISTPVD